jgi:hypothetical protein
MEKYGAGNEMPAAAKGIGKRDGNSRPKIQ